MFRLQLSVEDETFISYSFIKSILVAVPSLLKLSPHKYPARFPIKPHFGVYLIFIRRPNSRSAYGTWLTKGLLLGPCLGTSGRQRVPQTRVLSSTVSLYSTEIMHQFSEASVCLTSIASGVMIDHI